VSVRWQVYGADDGWHLLSSHATLTAALMVARDLAARVGADLVGIRREEMLTVAEAEAEWHRGEP
jgi:hypothetical protein